jgi:hypothetical protein
LPYQLWQDAMQHAVYITNNVPTSTTLYADYSVPGGVSTNLDIKPSPHTIPQSALFNEHSQIVHNKSFGCPVWYYDGPGHKDFNKIIGRVAPGVYIGGDSPTNHKVYVKETNKVIRTGHVSFNEQAQLKQPIHKPQGLS